MTRFLSDSLQAPEPYFRLGLRRLELANGSPNADIHISTEVMRATRVKLQQLGLDPHDTTPEELYHVLQERVKADDDRLTKKLRTLAATHVSADGEVVAGMVHALKELPDSKRCYAMKSAKLKILIKQLPPKKAMKQLGYRSLDSFLKHEHPVLVMSAAKLFEGSYWQQRFFDQYKKLSSSDFEDRSIAIIHPNSLRWQKAAKNLVVEKKHNLISLKELGALVFLPLPHDVPAGTVTASLALALHELNEIRASSTYLKLCQVRPDFARLVQTITTDEPQLHSELLDSPVPWHLIQRYYARLKQFGQSFEEPHIEVEDIAWHSIEKTLAMIEPSFEFWRGSAFLGMLDGRHPVSLNIVDASLNCCNHVPFEERIVRYFQRSLWHELLLRYFNSESVEETVRNELAPQLAEEVALA